MLAVVVSILVLPGLLSECGFHTPRRGFVPARPLRIDVERAAWYEWALLDGIGKTRAMKIVEFVNTRRPLASLDALREVPGLPSGWLDKARPHLYLAPMKGGGRPKSAPIVPENSPSEKKE